MITVLIYLKIILLLAAIGGGIPVAMARQAIDGYINAGL